MRTTDRSTDALSPPVSPQEMVRLIHDGLRTDLDRLAAAVERLDVDDRTTAARLGRWFRRFCEVLVIHHHSEDVVLFPAVVERAGDRFASAQRLDADHHRIDDLLGDITSQLDQLVTSDTGRASALARVRTDVEGLRHLLAVHLDIEETEVFDLLDDLFDPDEVAALHGRAEKLHPPRTLTFMAPWLLAHAPDEQAARLRAHAGVGVRVIERLVRPRYRRLDSVLPPMPASGPPSRRGRRSPAAITAVVVLAVALVATLAGCGSDGSDGAGVGAGAGSGEAAAADEIPSTVEVVAHDHHFQPSVEQVAAGPVTMRLVNEGAEAHQIHLARLPAGVTADDFTRTFETEGEPAAFRLVEWVGGVGSVEPGATAEATTELAAGEYVMVCFIPTPGPDGESHVVKGMVRPLEVVDAPSTADLPDVDATITLDDYSVEVPEGFDGGRVLVRNEGAEPHELILMRLHEGRSITDLIDWSAAGQPADKPFDYAGGIGTLDPGLTGSTPLDLAPGDYVALCVVPGPQDLPHVEMGMVTTFSVS